MTASSHCHCVHKYAWLQSLLIHCHLLSSITPCPLYFVQSTERHFRKNITNHKFCQYKELPRSFDYHYELFELPGYNIINIIIASPGKNSAKFIIQFISISLVDVSNLCIGQDWSSWCYQVSSFERQQRSLTMIKLRLFRVMITLHRNACEEEKYF